MLNPKPYKPLAIYLSATALKKEPSRTFGAAVAPAGKGERA